MFFGTFREHHTCLYTYRMLNIKHLDTILCYSEDIDFSYHYNGSSHDIYVRTVNLNQPWQKIEERIKQIIK